jgi:hypothetical protein
MWIVQPALRRTCTFVVAALVILAVSLVAIYRLILSRNALVPTKEPAMAQHTSYPAVSTLMPVN